MKGAEQSEEMRRIVKDQCNKAVDSQSQEKPNDADGDDEDDEDDNRAANSRLLV